VINKKRTLFLIFLALVLIPILIETAKACVDCDLNKDAFKKVNNEVVETKDSFENTMNKIDRLNNDNKVYYDKVQPIKDQYCFIKVQIKEINGEVIKSEVVECADGRKAYDGPSYWELFAQFYYGDMNTPAYCRYYERPTHAYHKPGKVCLDKNGNWEVRK
jgi:hypothetical protein